VFESEMKTRLHWPTNVRIIVTLLHFFAAGFYMLSNVRNYSARS